MMLTEVTAVPLAALPVQAMKDHLRLGSGLAMAPDQDALLESYLQAALAVVEGRIGKALFQRSFRLVLEGWRDAAEQALPLAPVTVVTEVRLFDAVGGSVLAPGTGWRLVQDKHRPKLAARGAALPSVPVDGRVEILFIAGFGAVWTDLPADLRQAVLLLAAEYYEHRHEDAASAPGLPVAVSRLIEGWRLIRTLGGGRR